MHRFLRVCTTAALLVVLAPPGLALPLLTQTTFGGAGSEIGSGIAVTASGVYFAGRSETTGAGLVGRFGTGLGVSPSWSRSWPGDGASAFSGIAVQGNLAYAAGYSHAQTTDTVGGKEIKGITVGFNADGTPGAGVGGAVLSRQTPAPPGAFPYGGIEWLTRITAASEEGQTRLYATGIGQQNGSDYGWGVFVAKLDVEGVLLWSRNAGTPTLYGSSGAPAIAAGPEGIFVASRNDATGGHPYLAKFDAAGNLLWTRTSAAHGEYRGITVVGGKLYAVGQTDVGSANSNFLIECWDGAGNPVWSKTYDRNAAQDTLSGAVAHGGHLYAVGSTRGNTAGGSDGIVLDVDLATGDLLDSTLWGGASDDALADAAVFDSTLYAVGSTSSFGAGNSDVAIVSWALPSGGNQPPVANAGVSRQVKAGQGVQLDGRASFDPEGQSITPSWSFQSRPAGSSAQLAGANTFQPGFVADQAGDYKVRLQVTDTLGASGSALVTLTATSNRPPVAVIVPRFGTLVVPTEVVLDGKASSDPDGDPITFRWRLVSRPAASKRGSLSGATGPSPTLFMDVAGNYTVELTVWDIREAGARSQITVTGLSGSSPWPPKPEPVVCSNAFGSSSGGYQTMYYTCDGRRITQEAVTGRLIPPGDMLAGFSLRDSDSTAIWLYGEGTGPILRFDGRFAYYANCTRNPLPSPTQITDQVFPPSWIENLRINGRLVTASLCSHFGSVHCSAMRPRTLPPCATR